VSGPDATPPEADGADAATQWRRARREAARTHEVLAARAARSDERKARALIADFVAQARESGLPTVALQAVSYNGRRYRTGHTGWYLRRSRAVGVDVDGHYYVLRVPPEPLGWLRGVHVDVSVPPLVVGRGGRDGDAIELAELLRRRLAAGVDF
jgi:hypothetical protein